VFRGIKNTAQKSVSCRGTCKTDPSFPLFQRGTEGVVFLNFNSLIIIDLINPLYPPLKNGEVKSQRF